MAQYTVQLQNDSIVYASEKVTVPGGYGTLVRSNHYVMDYTNGTITFDLSKMTSYPLSSLQNIVISYKYQVNFNDHCVLESHIPVYNELVELEDTWKVKVTNSPIADVLRVYNVTTKEEYVVESVSDDIIEISGYNAPAQTSIIEQTSTVQDVNVSGSQLLLSTSIPYPSGKVVTEHLLVSVDRVYATTKAIRLIEGRRTIYSSSWSFIVEPEVYAIDIYTGNTLLRRSKTRLIETTDYTYTLQNNQLDISFTSTGQSKISTNSVYLYLYKNYSPLESSLYNNEEYRVNYMYSSRLESITFSSAVRSLTRLFTYVESGQLNDVIVESPISVVSSTGSLYVEDIDYTINYQQGQIIKLSTGNISNNETVTVYYRDAENVYVDFTYLSDTVVVDYEWGANVLNWNISATDTSYSQDVNFDALRNRQIVKLDYYPANWEDILIYKKGDSAKVAAGRVTDYRESTNDIFIRDVVVRGDYVLEYLARSQLIEPNVVYYVSYKYGARRDALINHFAKLMGITSFTTVREETFELTTLQNTVVLTWSPIDRTGVLIYREDDIAKVSVTTVTDYNESTKVLTFNPIGVSGTYIFEYRSVGCDTNMIRKAAKGMMNALQEGPTIQGFKDLIAAFTDEIPTIALVSEEGIVLGSDSDSSFTGSLLAPMVVEYSPNKSDGTVSIDYLPSRFNTGLSIESQNGAWIRIDGKNNLNTKEGTIEFLFGNFFHGSDQQIHYLIDGVGTDNATDRIALYKNSQGYLCFELFDTNSVLYRSTINVNRLVTTESHVLKKDDTQVTLNSIPAYTLIDINENLESDIFEADESKFLIYPVYTDQQKLLPLYITIEVLIGSDNSYSTSTGYNNVVDRLSRLATIVENHNGKLSIFTELDFMQGCNTYGNTLKTLMQNGHSIGVYAVVPSDLIHEDERKIYIQQRKTYLEDLLGEEVTSIASGTQINNAVNELSNMDFNVISEYVDPFTLDTIDFDPYVYRPDNSSFTTEDEDGPIVYVPGASNWGWNKDPITAQSIEEIEMSLRTFLRNKVSNKVNSWYLTLHIEDLSIGSYWLQELDLFDSWFTSVVDPLVASSQIEWKTIPEIYERFLFWELWYNEEGFSDIRHSTISPLTFNRHTKVLTFESIPEDGTYMFDYISGWSKYEETEHFIAITWKLHTEDGLSPYYKLFLDGKLNDTVRFGSL